MVFFKVNTDPGIPLADFQKGGNDRLSENLFLRISLLRIKNYGVEIEDDVYHPKNVTRDIMEELKQIIIS